MAIALALYDSDTEQFRTATLEEMQELGIGSVPFDPTKARCKQIFFAHDTKYVSMGANTLDVPMTLSEVMPETGYSLAYISSIARITKDTNEYFCNQPVSGISFNPARTQVVLTLPSLYSLFGVLTYSVWGMHGAFNVYY